MELQKAVELSRRDGRLFRDLDKLRFRESAPKALP
jgi:hypothetical protein